MNNRAVGWLTLVALLGSAVTVFAQQAPRPDVERFEIRTRTLSEALRIYADQTGQQVVFFSEIGRGLESAAVVGNYTREEALRKLLDNTGLKSERLNAKTIAITDIVKNESSPPSQTQSLETSSEGPTVRLARAEAENSAAQPPAEDRSSRSSNAISEIIVTAQKREERLQDVPVPVTVVSAQALVDSNQTRLQDYYTKIPGLSLTTVGDVGSPAIAIRGVTTGGFLNPVVGIVVDDIPFGASTIASGTGLIAADLDPSDLARVEVLRGPQGTLYGASSMGGLLKYVTIDPALDRMTGRVQVGATGVRKSSDVGYNLSAALNAPLSDRFAVRLSGSTRQNPGYIDNIQTGQDDINRTDSRSGRLAALWLPNDDFSLKLSALYQHAKRDGSADTHLPSPAGPQTSTVSGRPDLQDLQQTALIDSGRYENRYQAYSATMALTLGQAELISLSGYNVSRLLTTIDLTPALGFASAQFGVGGITTHADADTSKFTQELRLSTPIGDRVEWLVGGFYTREKYPATVDVLAVNTLSGAIAGIWSEADRSGAYEEFAGFTDATFKITDRFDIQVGARQSQYTYANGQSTTAGPLNTLFGSPLTVVTPEFTSKEGAFTYLLTPQFKISPHLMVYSRLASGYRPGGPNTNALAIAAGLPREFGPDKTQNYELGLKGDAFDGAVSYEGSIYYIDWKDVQLQLRDPITQLLTYTLNAGAAKSEGTELSLQVKPLAGLTISGWGAYNNAVLTEVPTNSDLTARSGDRLPYSSRVSGNISVNQDFPLANGANGFIGAAVNFVGDRKGRFFRGFPQETFPAYTQLDLRGGAAFRSWTLNAFVNNVADKRGVLQAGRDATFSFAYYVTYIQPRTFGLSLARDF